MKVQKEWVDFQIIDLTNDETITITKNKLEQLLDDKFVAMQLDDNGKPVVIWTEKYVCNIKDVVMFGDDPILVLRRNPEFV